VGGCANYTIEADLALRLVWMLANEDAVLFGGPTNGETVWVSLLISSLEGFEAVYVLFPSTLPPPRPLQYRVTRHYREP